MKKISVIVPAYNEENNIGIAIDLLKKQDHKNFEIIIIDNNSTDRTFEIAKSKGVTVLKEFKKGTNNALECGRQAATGEIIVRMDADCLPDPWWLSLGAKHFEDDRVSALTGPYDYYDSKSIFRWITLFIQKYIYSITNHQVQLLGLGAVLTGGNSFMRATSLEKIGGFDKAFLFYGDDSDTAKKLSKHGKVIFHRKLVIKTSARRFQKEGVIKITWLYFKGFMLVLSGLEHKLKQ